MPLKHYNDGVKPEVRQDNFVEYSVNGWLGDTFFAPEDVANSLPKSAKIHGTYQNGIFARMIEDGGMNVEEWQGPYRTEEEALWALYEDYGDDEGETFFHFIGEGHQFEEGSLEIRDHDHLWGFPLGEMDRKEPRLVHICQSKDMNQYEWMDDDGNEGFERIKDLNHPDSGWVLYQLQDSFGFDVPTGEDKKELLKRIKLAQRS